MRPTVGPPWAAFARCLLPPTLVPQERSSFSRPRLVCLVDSISHVKEIKQNIDLALGSACITKPSHINSHSTSSKIIMRVKNEFGIGGVEGEEKRGSSFIYLGGFRNVRVTCELECKAGEPEKAKEMLEGFLLEKEVEYNYSKESKFAVFRAGTLLH
ncbi:triphosphate tunel metalloenzyme 3-like [Phalaenopsis equestris]|uniref:triphosphate tunel metalloenzyme 3-like n=1 Tax=Phalaenopsis equestris TaxID=78828 RepID=UPI0009E3358B|nr:triphosphate tunel metalloenzyme 3-like [Phalaenopsis equestris]